MNSTRKSEIAYFQSAFKQIVQDFLLCALFWIFYFISVFLSFSVYLAFSFYLCVPFPVICLLLLVLFTSVFLHKLHNYIKSRRQKFSRINQKLEIMEKYIENFLFRSQSKIQIAPYPSFQDKNSTLLL